MRTADDAGTVKMPMDKMLSEARRGHGRERVFGKRKNLQGKQMLAETAQGAGSTKPYRH